MTFEKCKSSALILCLVFVFVKTQNISSLSDYEDRSGIIQICGFRDASNVNEDWLHTRIVGGTAAKKHKLKWQASIRRGRRHICGGTVIGKSWVATAAHCIDFFQPNHLVFVAGDHVLNTRDKSEQSRRASVFIKHENYDRRTQQNDIGLAKMSTPYDFSTFAVAPACLPSQLQTFRGRCLVSGWGRTQEKGQNARVLQKVWLTLMSDATCRSKMNRIGYQNTIANTMLCAGEASGGKDACQGDSGGPLVCAGTGNLPMLAGIVSWGVGCARKDIPGVYTEVAHYTNWISRKVFSTRNENEVDENKKENEVDENKKENEVDENEGDKNKIVFIDNYINSDVNKIQSQRLNNSIKVTSNENSNLPPASIRR